MTTLKLTFIVRMKRLRRVLKSGGQKFSSDIRVAFRRALKDALNAIIMGICICITVVVFIFLVGVATFPFWLAVSMGAFPDKPQSIQAVLFSWPFLIEVAWLGFCYLLFRQYAEINKNTSK